jgi:hypothetical protein
VVRVPGYRSRDPGYRVMFLCINSNNYFMKHVWVHGLSTKQMCGLCSLVIAADIPLQWILRSVLCGVVPGACLWRSVCMQVVTGQQLRMPCLPVDCGHLLTDHELCGLVSFQNFTQWPEESHCPSNKSERDRPDILVYQGRRYKEPRVLSIVLQIHRM